MALGAFSQSTISAIDKEFLAELEKNLGRDSTTANLKCSSPQLTHSAGLTETAPNSIVTSSMTGLLPPPPSSLSRWMSSSMSSLSSKSHAKGGTGKQTPQNPSEQANLPIPGRSSSGQPKFNSHLDVGSNLRVCLPDVNTTLSSVSPGSNAVAHVKPFIGNRQQQPLNSHHHHLLGDVASARGTWRTLTMGSSRGSSPQYQPLREDLQVAGMSGSADASLSANPSTATFSAGGRTQQHQQDKATAMVRPINHLEINKIAQVGKNVSGVSASQCRMALEAVNWDTVVAIKNLKIVLRIGVADKPKCEKVLASVGWELEQTASRLLDE